MWFWRQRSFEGLTEVAVEAAKNPDTVLYAKYCEYREQGTRKMAFEELDRFIESARTWHLEKRFRFVDWLNSVIYHNPDFYDLIPYPLNKQIFEPTLKEWISVNPDDPVGYRWLGGTDNLRKAVRLSDSEQIARLKLIKSLFYRVDYSVHHLPEAYIGDPGEDLMVLHEISELIPSVEDVQVARASLAKHGDYLELVQSYLDYFEAGSSTSFEDWAEINQRRRIY